MGTAEVAAEAGCLERRLGGDAGFFCEKVSDLGPRTVVLQLQRSGQRSGTGEAEKVMVVLESGVRFHSTKYPLERPDHPSNFAMKLRKHLKQKRLVCVSQVGFDRVVDFEFERAGGTNHVLLELYARGNIVLTDGDYKVLTLLRSHRDDAAGIEATMANRPYPLNQARDSEVGACGKEFLARAQVLGDHNGDVAPGARWVEAGESETGSEACADGSTAATPAPARGRREDGTLGGLLRSLCPYGPAIADHCLQMAGLKPGAVLKDELPAPKDLEKVCEALQEFEAWIVSTRKQGCPGAVFTRFAKRPSSQGVAEEEEVEVFEGYQSFPLVQFASRAKKSFGTFDEALDEYYHGLESQQASLQQHRKEQQVLKKLDKVRNDFNVRQQALEAQAAASDQKAALIELNLDLVDLVIRTTNEAIASGMSWGDLSRMVAQGRESGNEMASAIHSLQLEKNCITLSLTDPYEEDAKPCSVSVDLGISAHANARHLYTARKKHVEKQSKTSEASHRVVKKAERTAKVEMKKVKVTASVREVRQQHWFEKFHWFVSSEKFLVFGGRDVTQNDIIMRRHFLPGDVLVHADLRGAPCCIVKNPKGGEVPPSTLAQAGTFCTCLSEAWKAKVVTSAWWVSHSQVEIASSTSPGENFQISGKRNVLPPARLVMGLSILFKEHKEGGPDAEDDETNSEMLPDSEGIQAPGTMDVGISGLAEANENMESLELQDSPPAGGGRTTPVTFPSQGLASANRSVEREIESAEEMSDAEEDILDALSTPALGSLNKQSGSTAVTTAGFKKSALQEPNPDHGAAHRYVTAKQRRDMKKTGQVKDGAVSETSEESQATERDGASAVEEPKSVLQKKVRGKHGKKKKMKAKYMDQDEEDRALMMELLGSAKSKTASENKSSEDKDASEGSQRGKGSGPQGRIGGKRQAAGLQRAHRDRTDALAEEDPQAAEEMRKIQALREKSRLAEMTGLTGCPPDDAQLLYGMAMVAPYAAIQGSKFKVKLTPGSGKRGKVGKTAQSILAATPGATSREKDLILAIGGDELSRTILGNVKVTGATRGNAKKY